jgi:hypothetical protein
MLSVIKRDKLKQSTQVFEESPPGGCRASDGAVSIVQPFQCGMSEESHQVEGGQKVGQMLFAVSKVMVEVRAVVLEDIVVFVLDFPTGMACGDGLHDRVFINGVRCSPGIAAIPNLKNLLRKLPKCLLKLYFDFESYSFQ